MSSKVQVLPRLSVLPDTFRKYKKGYKMFRTWLDTEVWKGHRLMPLTEKELDEALVDWTEYEMDWNPRRGNMQDCARARNMIKDRRPWSNKHNGSRILPFRQTCKR